MPKCSETQGGRACYWQKCKCLYLKVYSFEYKFLQMIAPWLSTYHAKFQTGDRLIYAFLTTPVEQFLLKTVNLSHITSVNIYVRFDLVIYSLGIYCEQYNHHGPCKKDGIMIHQTLFQRGSAKVLTELINLYLIYYF